MDTAPDYDAPWVPLFRIFPGLSNWKYLLCQSQGSASEAEPTVNTVQWYDTADISWHMD